MNKNIFKDIVINQKFSHKRKIKLKDTKDFIKLTKDENKLHKTKINNKILVHGLLLNSLIAKILGTDNIEAASQNIKDKEIMEYLGESKAE